MKRRNLRTCLTLLFSLCMVYMTAQPNSSIKGNVVDAQTNASFDYADVVLINKASVAVAQTTLTDGAFVFSDIPKGSYQVLILFAGYETYTSKPLTMPHPNGRDLGTISLKPLSQTLDNVEVVAERKQIIYKIDKRSISASQNLMATGGTAVDILENTPSVRVNADGELTFRGSSNFNVYVNGKPAVLSGTQALEQIPAGQIDNIEIITTPSAQYDSNGDVGIINIITKKDFEAGLNGVVNLTGSTIGSWGGDFFLNKQNKDSKWFVSGEASRIRRESNFDQRKTTMVDNISTTSHSVGPREGINQSYSLKGGYEVSNHNNSLYVEAQAGYWKRARNGDMTYDEDRITEEGATKHTYNSKDSYYLEQNFANINFNYTHKFNDKGHHIKAGVFVKHDWNALEYYESNMYDKDQRRVDGTKAYEGEHRWSVQGNLDYVLPYSETGNFTAGYQITHYSEHGDYKIKFWDKEVYDYYWREDLFTPYYYQRGQNAVYAMWKQKVAQVEMQAGLRGEHTHDVLDIDMQDKSRNRHYFDLYPSAHLAYAMPHEQTMSLGYSRRVNRPGIWQLEPYITYEDYYTAMMGNPDIKAEFINVFELNYRKSFAEGNLFSATLFHRARSNKMERVRVAYLPGVTLDSLANVGKDYSSGIELSAQLKLMQWWNLNVNGSAYYYKFKNEFASGSNADSYNYDINIHNNFAITGTTRLQFDANLIGPMVTSQGKENAYCYFNLSARQQLLNRKLSATLTFRDIFNTARYTSTRSTDNLSSHTRIRPRYPNIMLSISYIFNNFKTKESKSKANHDLFEGSDY